MGQRTEELSRDIAGTRQDLASDLDALQDRVSPQAIVERRKAATRERVRSARYKVMGTAHSARESATGTASGAADSVRDQAHGAASAVEDRVEGSPLAAGLVAFGAGMVLASLLPATEKESRAARQVVDTAREQGQPVVEEARSVAQQVGQDLQESATDHAQELKESAQESTSRVQDEGSSAVEEVRGS